jgi:hypothetical protein
MSLNEKTAMERRLERIDIIIDRLLDEVEKTWLDPLDVAINNLESMTDIRVALMESEYYRTSKKPA